LTVATTRAERRRRPFEFVAKAARLPDHPIKFTGLFLERGAFEFDIFGAADIAHPLPR
jgi:hypothetical protein